MPRVLRVVGPAVLLVVALVALLLALVAGGGSSGPTLAHSGALVHVGLPISRLLFDVAASGTLGALVLVCFILSPRSAEFARALDFGAASAALMTVAGAVTGFFSFLGVSHIQLSASNEFGAKFGSFVTSSSLGQAWLAATLVAAVLTVLCFAVRNHTALLFVTAVAVCSLVPLASQGAMTGSIAARASATALLLHVVFAALWVGALLTLVVLSKRLDPSRLLVLASQYSTLALVCFVVVAASGFLAAGLQVGDLANLRSAYGILVLVKVAVLVALGALGVLQRRYSLRLLERSTTRSSLWWLVTLNLAFLGVASGVAVALGLAASPERATGHPLTPAEILTGQPLPPLLTVGRYVASWSIDLPWMLACGFCLFCYVVGVRRLARTGERWPVHRSILWAAGLLVLFWLTNGGPSLYGQYVFSANLLGRLLIAMLVPLLLVPASPVTLALRTIRVRDDGSRGAREWIELAAGSGVAHVVTHPIVAFVLFAGALWALYFTPLLRWTTTAPFGPDCAVAVLLAAGCLFVYSSIGLGSRHRRPTRRLHAVLAAAALVFFAAFGLVLRNSAGLLVANWFGAMGRTWGASPLEDQQAGGLIAWIIGGALVVVLAVVVGLGWNSAGRGERAELLAERGPGRRAGS